jgi:hypothetical protein
MAGDLCRDHCGFNGGIDYLGRCEVVCNVTKESYRKHESNHQQQKGISIMKKNLVLVFTALVALLILVGTSYSFTKEEVTTAIKKELVQGGDMMAIKIVMLSVSDVQTGIMQKKSQYNPYDRTTRVWQELPYEAKIKVNCVRRNDNKIMKTLTDDISGALTRNKMGRYEISGVDSVSGLCRDYNIGCVSGNCENGLGVELFAGSGEYDKYNVLFMGTYKNGKKQCGFESPLTAGWLEITGTVHAEKFNKITELYHYETGADCDGEPLVESLLKAKYITKHDYEKYKELSKAIYSEEEENTSYKAESK